MKLEEILKSLEADCGTGALIPDEEGVYSLNHEGTTIEIFPLEEGARALLYAALADVPESGAGALAQVLLQENHSAEGERGGAFAIDPEENSFCLQALLDCERLGYEGFALALLAFIEQAKRSKTSIEQFSPEASQVEAHESAPEAPVTIPNNWWLSV